LLNGSASNYISVGGHKESSSRQSGNTKEERLSSAAVSRYSTGKIASDAASCQKIARAFDMPVELVLRKAGLINTPFSNESDWLQQAIDNLAYAVEVRSII